MEQRILNMWLGNESTKMGLRSNSGDAVKTTSYAEDYIAQGYGFQMHRLFSIAGNATLYIVADFSSLVDTAVFTLPLVMNTSESQCFMETYKISNYTGGVLIPSTNRNGLSANLAKVKIYSGIATSDVAGDDLRQYIVGTLSTRQNSGGGSGGGGYPKIFGGDLLVFKVASQEAVSAEFELNFNWYEIPISNV